MNQTYDVYSFCDDLNVLRWPMPNKQRERQEETS